METLRGFTTSQAARLTGLKYATVDYWARTGFISPSLATARGKGTDRLYGFQDLVALRVARELRQAGVSLQCLRQVVHYLREKQGAECPLAEKYLVTDGKDVYVKDGDSVLSTLRQPGQGCFLFVIDVGHAIAELQESVARLSA